MEISSQAAAVKFRANPDFLLRQIGDEAVLVPVGDAGVFENSMLSLNATCSYLWKQFQTPRTVPEVIRQAAEDFEGNEEEIARDICDFVISYAGYGLLKEE